MVQRENAIVNRLNKTRVERKPDLKLEKDDRLKELRKRDQAAQLLRVRSHPPFFFLPTFLELPICFPFVLPIGCHHFPAFRCFAPVMRSPQPRHSADS